MLLPSNVSTGRVTGQFLVGVVDGADADQDPDAVPARGSVTFTASVPYLPNPTAAPNAVTILQTPIVGVLDAAGYLCTPEPGTLDPSYRGVRLIATDDPDLLVEGWTWTAVYRFETVSGVPLNIPTHSFAVPSGAVVDLTTVVKVPASAGIGTEQAEALAAAAYASAQAADASADIAAQAALDAAGAAQVTDSNISTLITNPATDTGAATRALVEDAAAAKLDATEAAETYQPIDTLPDVVAGNVNANGTPINVAIKTIADAAAGAAASGRVPTTAVGAANGVAPLGADSKLQEQNVPARLGDAALAATYANVNGPAATSANTQRFLTKLYRGVEDVSVLNIGTSLGNETIEYVNLTWTQFAPRFPTHTFILHGWDETGGAAYDTGSAGAATTIQTGTGPRTVHIWRCNASGMRTDYTLGSRFQAAVLDPNPDLIFVEHGKNEGNSGASNPGNWRGQYLALTETLTKYLPYAGLVCVLEPLNSGDNDMALKNRTYEEIAQLRGYGVINAHDAFLATGDPTAYMKADGIHPTTSADAPAPNGSQLIADTILQSLNLDRRGGSVPGQAVSSLSQSDVQLLANGSFSAYSGSVPDGWLLTNATTSKDTRGGYFESANGYGVRLQASTAAPSKMVKNVPHAPLKGKWVTLRVRMRIAAGAANTAGRIAIADGVNTLTSFGALIHARDGFHERVLSFQVAKTAAYLSITLYGDTAANGSADVTFDRADLVEGVLPKNGSEGVPGPTGPSGTASVTAVDHLSTVGTNPITTVAGAQSALTLNTANQGIMVPFKPQRDMSITLLNWLSAGASGNYDIGIYDAAGNRLWAKGPTTWPASGTMSAEAVSPALALVAGATYYLVFTADNIVGTFRGLSSQHGDFLKMLGGTYYTRLVSSVFPLPSTITIGNVQSSKIPAVVFREA